MKDRNIYFKINEITFDFYYQNMLIAQFLGLEETIYYIRKKIYNGYNIKAKED